MWHDLLVALALVLVVEGVLPFVSPGSMRKAWMQMSQLDDRTLRMVGLACMALGAVFLQILR
jgi:uncharacterized protein YjeT (DUF2065 family)